MDLKDTDNLIYFLSNGLFKCERTQIGRIKPMTGQKPRLFSFICIFSVLTITVILFCSTYVPLTSTWWVWRTIRLCAVHMLWAVHCQLSKQHQKFSLIKNLQSSDSNPGQQGLVADMLSTVRLAIYRQLIIPIIPIKIALGNEFPTSPISPINSVKFELA